MFLPLFPYFFSHLSGFSTKEAGLLYGLLVGCFPFGQVIGNNLFGVISDLHGRRKLLIVSCFLQIGTGVFTAFSQSVWMLALARFLAGMFSGTSSVVQSYVADVTSKEDRGKELGRVGAFSGLGLIVGPVVGILFGYTVQPIAKAWFVASLTGAGISFVNLVLVIVFVKESAAFLSQTDEKKIRRICLRWGEMSSGRLRSVIVILFTSFVGAFAFILLEAVIPLLCIDVFQYLSWQLIVIFSGFLLVSILMQLLLFGRLMVMVKDIRNVATCIYVLGALINVVLTMMNNWIYTAA